MTFALITLAYWPEARSHNVGPLGPTGWPNNHHIGRGKVR